MLEYWFVNNKKQIDLSICFLLLLSVAELVVYLKVSFIRGDKLSGQALCFLIKLLVDSIPSFISLIRVRRSLEPGDMW